MTPLRRTLWIAAAVCLALFAIGVVPRLLRRRELRAEAEAIRDRAPLVATASPRRSDESVEVSLPGSMEAVLETGIWARTNGYLRSRSVDIGDRVKKGELLAEIDTPEIDQQLNQASALLAESKAMVVKLEADRALARTTLDRYQAAGAGAVSKQQIDERTSAVTDAEKAVEAGNATVKANEANVQRLRDLQSFQKVVAPFDGIVTVRNVDVGALISAGSTTGTTEIFRVAQVGVLRIFVYVPQTYAADVRAGQAAEVTVRERPGQMFAGKVTRTAGAIDPVSRTMRAEVQVQNPDGVLLSGSYATVAFKLSRAEPPLLVPSSALVVDASGVRVGVVGDDHALHYKPVQLGRDYGAEVEIVSGIEPTDQLATGLAGNLPEGSKVDVATPDVQQHAGGP